MSFSTVREWRYRRTDEKLARHLSNELDIPYLLARILVAREMKTREEVYHFLNPNLRSLHDPFLLPDMERGIDRILQGLRSENGIMIHGDYDADGITSTAVMVKALSSPPYKPKIIPYLPSRLGEGYGLSRRAIDRAHELGIDLIITVDCGITAAAEVEYAREKGIDVVITDHHEPEAELPNAAAVIDPKRKDSDYPFNGLAGVGVAFKVVTALQMRGIIDLDVRDLLDLVAIGTIADIVPLRDENRSLVSEGLKRMGNTDIPGLKALMRETKMDISRGVRSGDISFRISPRINSAGRMDHPDLALELLLTDDRVDADTFARGLNTMNYRRQAVGNRVSQEVHQMLMDEGRMEDPILIAHSEGWELGVLGISANKLLDETGRPTIVLTLMDGIAKGSARSPEGFDLLEALDSCSSLLIEYGGHEKAAGLTLQAENLDKLRDQLIQFMLDRYPTMEFRSYLEIDLDLTLAELRIDDLDELERLSPFGRDNPSPCISLSGVRIEEMRSVGDGKHLKLKLGDDSDSVGGIWFGAGEMISEINVGMIVNVAGTPEVHRWGGREEAQLNISDLRPTYR